MGSITAEFTRAVAEAPHPRQIAGAGTPDSAWQAWHGLHQVPPVAAQFWHAWPPVPHEVFELPVTQVVPLQHPLGQFCGLHCGGGI